jgi:fructokinase
MNMPSSPPKHRPTVVGCGFVAWDVVLGHDSAVKYADVGGTVGNVVSIMAFLGWHSVPMVRLGADHAGVRVLEELVSLGVDTSSIALNRHLRTPIVYQRPDDTPGRHSFSFRCPSCGLARHFSKELLEGVESTGQRPLSRGDVYFFDRLTAGSVSLAEQARANGALTVFEPSSVGVDELLFRRALHASHVVKYSADRIASSVLPALGAGFVEIQTMGSEGLRFRMRSLDPSWVSLPAIRTPAVVDTAGAGDWCTAGFLHVLSQHLHGGTLSDFGYNHVYGALRGGQAVAALNCLHTGARGLMRHVDALRLRSMLLQLSELGAIGATMAPDLDAWRRELEGSPDLLTALPPARSHGVGPEAQGLCCDALSGARWGTPEFH